jgi:hypothetical protein
MPGRWRALLPTLAACGTNPAFDEPVTGAPPDPPASSSGAVDPPTPTTTGTTSDTTTTGTTTGAVDPTTTGASSGTTTTADPTTSGTTTTGDETTTGALDPACPDDPDLVACYHFPAGEFTTLVDGSPAQRDGTLKDVNLPGGLPGHGAAAEFIDQSRATVKYDPAFGPKVFTLAALAFVKSKNRAVIDKQGQYALFVDDNEATCLVRAADTSITEVHAPIVQEAWLHLACTYDGATLTIHVHRDGMPVVANPTGWAKGVDTTAASDLAIGRDAPEESAFYLGLLDDVMIYRRALNPQELCVLAGPLCG